MNCVMYILEWLNTRDGKVEIGPVPFCFHDQNYATLLVDHMDFPAKLIYDGYFNKERKVFAIGYSIHCIGRDQAIWPMIHEFKGKSGVRLAEDLLFSPYPLYDIRSAGDITDKSSHFNIPIFQFIA